MSSRLLFCVKARRTDARKVSAGTGARDGRPVGTVQPRELPPSPTINNKKQKVIGKWRSLNRSPFRIRVSGKKQRVRVTPMEAQVSTTSVSVGKWSPSREASDIVKSIHAMLHPRNI